MAHLEGGQGNNVVTIREGIYDESVKKDLERDGPPVIPKNFDDLKNIETKKTSIRRPRDYPVLHQGFVDK